MRKALHIVLVVLAAILMLQSCSSTKNTARTRWWKAFNAHYNTYYNGTLAYIDGSLEKESGNQDNFTELIPLYTVGNKNSRELGKGNYDRAIEKAQKAIQRYSIKRRPVWDKQRKKTERDIEWLSRKEYNPFLWKAWMLMGRSQFHEGDFDGAASTFSYMSRLYATQPAIYSRAQAWLAKAYVESGWLYDAEEVIRNARRDSILGKAQKEWDYTLADYYLHTQNYPEAATSLRRVIKHEMRKKQRARECFLLGQVYALLGKDTEAYTAYRKAIRTNPPYQLELNARVAQSEVMATRQADKMTRRLKRMAAADNNKDYLDQIYYALGNIYLSRRDTANAIAAYEKGGAKSTRNGIEKGVLMLRLGNLYWEKERYADAQRCYTQAIGLLDKDRKDYEQLTNRSKVLDELVPYTEAVHLQDSLQALAKMDEGQRNAAIDRVIAALKKKEKEEKNKQQEAEASQRLGQGSESGNMTKNNTSTTTTQAGQTGTWYFYNPIAIQQGKQNFERLWGKRKNEDNWQRSNKTVVAATDTSAPQEEPADSTMAETDNDSITQEDDKKLEAAKDPHTREYYLAQIPFTADQLAASNQALCDGLFGSGVIFKDKLDNLPLSRKALERLVGNYPDYAKNDEAYYHLFLLYSRLGDTSAAQRQVALLKAKYPKSQWTALLSDPNYFQNARYGEQLEDSLYSATYEAFRAGRDAEVAANTRLSASRFPNGANRDKFIFIGGLSQLNEDNAAGCLEAMDTLVSKYPNSPLATLAGMIVNGVKSGRRLQGGRFDISNVWQQRNETLNVKGEDDRRKLSNERDTPFAFLLVYSPDSVNENKLLFEIARYNFTSYLVRDFDIAIDDLGALHRMRISGFRNYDEARQYANQLVAQADIAKHLGGARPFIVSETNLPLLGTTVSYDDYAKFYNAHFAPLHVSTVRLLTEPAEVVTQPSTEKVPETEKEVDDYLNGITVQPDEPTTPTGTTIPIDTDQEPTTSDTGATVVTDEQPDKTTRQPEKQTVQQTAQPKKDNSNVFEVEQPTKPVKTEKTEQTSVPAKAGQPSTPVKSETAEQKPTVPVKAEQPVAPVKTGKPQAPEKSKQPKQTVKEPERATMVGGAEIIFDDMPTTSGATTNGSQGQNTTKKATTDKGTGITVTTPQKKDNTPKKSDKQKDSKENTFDLEDEYYDLDGF